DVLGRPDVEAARRLAHDDELWLLRELAPQDDLLLVPTGEVADDRARVRRPYVELLREPIAIRADRRVVEHATLAERRMVLLPAIAARLETADVEDRARRRHRGAGLHLLELAADHEPRDLRR